MKHVKDDILLDGRPLIRRYYPVFGEPQAQRLFRQLCVSLPWEQPRVRVFGREYPAPRLQSWHGDPESVYRYSGLTLTPRPWTPELALIRERVEALTGRGFNSVLANLYRDGQDAMGWHADDEKELGDAPWVVSLSLGATRDFVLRRKGETRQALRLGLRHGELLVMAPEVQYYWQHSLPRRARVSEERINLTFRRVVWSP
jgi:alkylated DNA repair dioxygenase AlkB